VSALRDALTEAIASSRPRSACDLACDLRRRKADILGELHAGPFEQIGRGRAARWQLTAGLTTERLERAFDAQLNGQLKYLPDGFASDVLDWLSAIGYVDESLRRTAKADLDLGEFWAAA
jgi:hypothetical protein